MTKQGRPYKLGQFRSVEERDYEIYHAKFSACKSVKEIMKEFNLSQHRVYCIIREQKINQEDSK